MSSATFWTTGKGASRAWAHTAMNGLRARCHQDARSALQRVLARFMEGDVRCAKHPHHTGGNHVSGSTSDACSSTGEASAVSIG
ncbi:hypothetical protein, partial [Salmonella enterica]